MDPLPRGTPFDDLRAITAPTLVLTGDRDDFCSVEDAVTTYRSLSQGELAVIPDHAHHLGAAMIEASIEFLCRHADR